jgi:hypothetical protein
MKGFKRVHSISVKNIKLQSYGVWPHLWGKILKWDHDTHANHFFKYMCMVPFLKLNTEIRETDFK